MSSSSNPGLLILSSPDVDRITSTFSTTELTRLMAHAFKLSHSSASGSNPSSLESNPGRTYTPHRTSIPSQNHTVLFMPARISGTQSTSELSGPSFVPEAMGGTTAVKVVSIPYSSTDPRGLPASTLVLDEETGSVRAVVNARELTATRTAAGSLLSTILVGPRHPTSIVAFGTGKQIQAHLSLHLEHFHSIRECTVVYRTDARLLQLRDSLESRFPSVRFWYLSSSVQATKTRRAMWEASIVVCATPSTVPLFPSKWVKDGTHVILVGSFKPEMQEVETNLVRRAILDNVLSRSVGWEKKIEAQGRPEQILLVDSRSACKLESGEIIKADPLGEGVVEIGEFLLAIPETYDQRFTYDRVVMGGTGDGVNMSNFAPNDKNGSAEKRAEPGVGRGPITMFKSVGLGVQDVVMTNAVVRKAAEMGNVGVRILNYDTSSK